MATGSRTLKLSILADVDNLTKNLKSGSKDVETFGDQISDFGKKAAVAFTAAAAAIGAFAVSSIKNALADEAAQRKLEETLRASTAATEAQIASVGKWIDKTSLAIGVTDDELRPAFSRLARSTNDVENAQKLLNLALDISAATGAPLTAVSNALGKAYDGNAASLGRLGLGLDANLLKSKDTDKIFKTLTATFGNFAENEAETTAKKFERVKIAIDEAQESIGAALLPIVEKLATFLLVTLIPNMNLFVSALTGKDGLVDGVDKSGEAAYQWGLKIKGMIETVIDLKDEIIAVGAVIATVFVVSKIAAFVSGTIALIKSLIVAYNALKASSIVAGVASAFALNPLLGVGAVALAAGVLAGANALANSSNTSTDFGNGSTTTGALGNYQMSTGTFIASKASGLSDGLGDITGGGGGGGGGALGEIVGAKNLTELVSQLTSVSNNIADLQFLVDTNGISKAAGQKQLDALVKQFDVLSKQADALNATVNAPTFNAGSFRAGEAATMGTTINVTVNGAIDSEGTARTVVNTLNDSFYRGTLGAGALVGAFDK
jgi:hypothetical protein